MSVETIRRATADAPSTGRRAIKRTFIECCDEVDRARGSRSSSPLKKHKYCKPQTTKSTFLLLNQIRSVRQPFHWQKLQLNKEYTKQTANDSLFNQQQSSKHARWVIACKFVIASGLRLDSYHILGMSRSKIPSNMCFFVDDHHNLCALIHDSQYSAMSHNIIKRCNRIATSTVQTFNGMSDDPEAVRRAIDTLDSSSIRTLSKEQPFRWKVEARPDHDGCKHSDVATLIRIPMVYYTQNMRHSFYEVCCRLTRHLVDTASFSHSLFQLFFKNIANFDSFQTSVPLVPLSGSVYTMYCHYRMGVCDDVDVGLVERSLYDNDLGPFMGTLACWDKMEKRRRCREVMNECWFDCTGINRYMMELVVGYADLNAMDDDEMLCYVDRFLDSRKYVALLRSECDQRTKML